MLVLTRKVGEAVDCSGPCRVKYVGREGNEVRLGFDGEKVVKFLRAELTPYPVTPAAAIPLRAKLIEQSRALHALVREHAAEVDFLPELIALKFKIDAMLGRQ